MAIDVFYNPIYLKHVYNCTDEVVILFGGAGSGKSQFTIYMLIEKYFLQPNNDKKPEKLLFVRKVARTIKHTLWSPVVEVLKFFDVWGEVKSNETDKTIVDSETGNEIVMVGLDDVDKLKSIHGITKIFIEEADAVSETDILQLKMRMRGEYNGVYQLFLCFNPVADTHFLVGHAEPQYLEEAKRPKNIKGIQYLNENKTAWRITLEDEEGGQSHTTVLNTTYHHNLKLDKGYKTKLKLMAAIDDVYYQVYEKGRWGHIVAGNAYCHQFKESKHVKPTKYTPKQPIHYTLDFNVNPHMTGLCLQMSYENKRYKVRIFKQYALKHPKNEGYHLGASFVADFLDVMVYEVFLYGDASGNNRLGISDSKSLFSDVMKGFGKHQYGVHKRVPNSNPRYDKIAVGAMGRKSFTNAIFSGELGVDIEIDPSCTELIADCRQCTQDANGKLAKPKNKDGYEERGHALQALEYALCHKDFLGSLALLDYIPNK